MSTLVTLTNGFKVLNPTPSGAGGSALNDNFALADAKAGTLAAHLIDTSNPHAVTAGQIGALPVATPVATTSLTVTASGGKIKTTGTAIQFLDVSNNVLTSLTYANGGLASSGDFTVNGLQANGLALFLDTVQFGGTASFNGQVINFNDGSGAGGGDVYTDGAVFHDLAGQTFHGAVTVKSAFANGTRTISVQDASGNPLFSFVTNGSANNQLEMGGQSFCQVYTTGAYFANFMDAAIFRAKAIELSNFNAYGDTSGVRRPVTISPTYQMGGTAGAADLTINRTETSLGSGVQLLLDCQVGGASKFRVDHTGAIQVANAAAATTPGSVVKKLPIYDATGTLLGYVPIYSSIT